MNKLTVLPWVSHAPLRRRGGRMLGMALLSILPMVLSSCDKVTALTQRNNTNASVTSDTASGVSATHTASAVSNPSTQPINYPFDQWQQQTVTKLPLKDINAINQHIGVQLGKAPKTDTKSLDFNSNPATQYQFANPATPYFDVIDSPKFVEFGWYYSNINDNAREQKLGINYAGHVYQLARGWLGNREGAQLVENMLMGQTIRDATINGVGVAMAKCEFFSCILVLKK